MADIAIYTFVNGTNTLPLFNDGFTYEYTDVDNGNGTTTRTITNEYVPTSISFRNKTGLISLSYLNTSGLTDMSYMFIDCNNMTSIDLSRFDTTNVIRMRNMFYNCVKLKSLDLSSFDTTNVTDMSYMFYNCTGLESLNLSGFDTSNVLGINNIFGNCDKLSSINIRSRMININDIISNLPVRNVESPGTLMIETTDEKSINVEQANANNWIVNNHLIVEFITNNDAMPTFNPGFIIETVDVVNDNGTITRTITSDNLCTFISFVNCTGIMAVNYLNIANLFIEDNMFEGCTNLNTFRMKNSNVNIINTLISALPTRMSIGKLYVNGLDNVSGVDKTTAVSKKWKIVFQENRTNTLVPIRLANKCVRAVYTDGEKIL